MTPSRRAGLFFVLKMGQVLLAFTATTGSMHTYNLPAWTSSILYLGMATAFIGAIFVNPEIRRNK